MTKHKIEQDPEQPVDKKVLAQSIVAVAKAAAALFASGLKTRTICLLIKDQCPHLGLRDIQSVLDAAAQLDQEYTTLK